MLWKKRSKLTVEAMYVLLGRKVVIPTIIEGCYKIVAERTLN